MKLAIFFAVFLTFEVIVATPTNEIEAVDPVKIVKVVFKDLVKVLNVTTDLVQEFDDAYAKNPNGTLEQIEKLSVNAANKIYDHITNITEEILDILEDNLNASGKKGVACIRKERGKLEDLVDTAVLDFISCLGPEIPQLISSYQGLLTAGLEIRYILSAAEVKLEKCALGQLCLIQLLNDLKELETPLINAVKALPSLVTEIVTALKYDVPKCLGSDVKSIRSNLISLIDETMNCIVS